MKEKFKLAPVAETAGTEITETISEVEQSRMENLRLKSELAIEKVKTAIAQKENVEMSYNNLVLQLALKYRLNEGDVIEPNGMITRRSDATYNQ